MFAYVLMILMAWFISMPLWLSILTTSLCGISIIIKIIKLALESVE